MLEMMAIQAGDGVPQDGEAGVEYGGGYFVRRMKDENDDWYALVISPAAEGSYLGGYTPWQDAMDYVAGLTIGGHNDWKLMTLDEARTIYREFKPNTIGNNTSYGATDRVEPPLGDYTSGDPSQTSLTDWQGGGPEAFVTDSYWTEDESSQDRADRVSFNTGYESNSSKENNYYVRAVRRHYY